MRFKLNLIYRFWINIRKCSSKSTIYCWDKTCFRRNQVCLFRITILKFSTKSASCRWVRTCVLDEIKYVDSESVFRSVLASQEFVNDQMSSFYMKSCMLIPKQYREMFHHASILLLGENVFRWNRVCWFWISNRK